MQSMGRLYYVDALRVAAFVMRIFYHSSVAFFPDMSRLIESAEGSALGAQRMANFEITPEGNGVTLEDEMMKVTTNLMDYQAATSLYQKSIKILRTAMGRQS